MLFTKPKLPVLYFDGAIAMGAGFVPGVSYGSMHELIERAFSVKGRQGVALRINCGGGAPTQAHMLHSRIRQLADSTGTKVYAFIDDAATSAGYWLACAADEIYAQPTSMVGSIGIVSSSFGVDGLLERFGITRRNYATGAGKTRMDPFLPERPDDAEWLDGIQSEMRDVFVDVVRSRRRQISMPDDILLSGDSWVGPSLIRYGLIDGFGDIHSFAAERFGPKVTLEDIVEKPDWRASLLKSFI